MYMTAGVTGYCSPFPTGTIPVLSLEANWLDRRQESTGHCHRPVGQYFITGTGQASPWAETWLSDGLSGSNDSVTDCIASVPIYNVSVLSQITARDTERISRQYQYKRITINRIELSLFERESGSRAGNAAPSAL